MNKLTWLTKRLLRRICWRSALIPAACSSCGIYKLCGNVPDIGFACEDCQKTNLWVPIP